MGQFSDVKWPAEYTELTRIEGLLHCRICYEYIETSVITPCSHNYCSLCIRKFLHYKTQCPVCFETIYEKDLHANRILDEFTQLYLSLREKLLACIKGAEVGSCDLNSSNFTPVKQNTPDKTSRPLFRTPTKKLYRDNSDPSPSNLNAKETRLVKTPCNKSAPNLNSNSFTPKEISQAFNTPRKNNPLLSKGSSGTPRMNSIFAVKSEERVEQVVEKKRVPCPVCSIEISETNINRHLDDCLKRQRSMSPKIKKNDLEPMPKYVMNLMKDGELRKLLKKYGLSTSGARKAMEKRLQKFSALYNAERDKLEPKSVEELVKLCEREETAERNISKQNSFDHIPGIDRKADQTLIEKAHKEYLQRNRDDYQKLIETINSRERERSRPSRSLFGFKTGEESVSVASTSSASQTTTSHSFLNQSDEANETNSSAADTSHWLPLDSDSTNTSYPLQHYSNEDPMQFLALEISSDGQESRIKSETSSSRNLTPLSCAVKTESSEHSMYNSDLLNSSNSGLTSQRVEDLEHLGMEINASNYDIFEASTEDNWSDSGSRDLRKTRSKKFVMKRIKAEKDGLSTDSETDTETKIMTKTKKNRGKKGARDNGSESGEKKSALDIEFEAVSGSSVKPGKENSEVESGDVRIARRSSRKRNHVSYAVGSAKERNKPLDELPVNFTEGNSMRDTHLAVDSVDQPANATLRSLRTRRKR